MKPTPEDMAYCAEYYEGYAEGRASPQLKSIMAEKAKLYRRYEQEARNGEVCEPSDDE